MKNKNLFILFAIIIVLAIAITVLLIDIDGKEKEIRKNCCISTELGIWKDGKCLAPTNESNIPQAEMDELYGSCLKDKGV